MIILLQIVPLTSVKFFIETVLRQIKLSHQSNKITFLVGEFPIGRFKIL